MDELLFGLDHMSTGCIRSGHPFSFKNHIKTDRKERVNLVSI